MDWKTLKWCVAKPSTANQVWTHRPTCVSQVNLASWQITNTATIANNAHKSSRLRETLPSMSKSIGRELRVGQPSVSVIKTALELVNDRSIKLRKTVVGAYVHNELCKCFIVSWLHWSSSSVVAVVNVCGAS